MNTDYYFPMNTTVLLSNDFEPANNDEAHVYDYSVEGRITDLRENEQANGGAEYYVTFDDTEKDNEGDIAFWVCADHVELA